MATENNYWSKWWFLNGGMLHRLEKDEAFFTILELARSLPKAAWDEQQKKIDELLAAMREIDIICHNAMSEQTNVDIKMIQDIARRFCE